VTVKRWTYDNAQRHVTAFRPIIEAAHIWSYDRNILAPRRHHGVRVAAFRSASPVVYTSFRVIAVVFTDEDRELLTKNAPRVISSTCWSSSSSISHAGNVLSTGNLIPRTLMSCLKASWPVFEKACATAQNNVKSLVFGSWKKRSSEACCDLLCTSFTVLPVHLCGHLYLYDARWLRCDCVTD